MKITGSTEKELPVVIDPRILAQVTTGSACHLIPACFKFSGKTVFLDGPFDHKIGEQCDCHLKAYFDIMVAPTLQGKLSFEGGSAAVTGTVNPGAQQWGINLRFGNKKKRRQTQPDAGDSLRKALGMQPDGQVKVQRFVTPYVDTLKARLSMINSAILILYYLRRKEVYSQDFDSARLLLRKACEGKLEAADLSLAQELTPQFAWAYFKNEKASSVQQITFDDARKLYDGSLDPGDGIEDDFPNHCLAETNDALVVHLPYGKALRGMVRFPFQRNNVLANDAELAHETTA